MDEVNEKLVNLFDSHTRGCVAYAVGCALENVEDARQDPDTVRWAESVTDPLKVASIYIHDGDVSCHCFDKHVARSMTWARGKGYIEALMYLDL